MKTIKAKKISKINLPVKKNSEGKEKFDHGISANKYNPHCWITGTPEIGEGTWIGAFTHIDSTHAKLRIGRGCNIAAGAKILTHSTVRRCISERKIDKVDAADTVIGDYCFIGINAVILMGAQVGHHSVIGAGAVVTEYMKVPPYSLVTGVPGKVVGTVKKYLKT